MSFKALAWAMSRKMDHSPSKFVLVAMANYADEDDECYPSIKRLSDDTCLNRKTVISARAKLKLSGFIRDTGKRRGRTGQSFVYQLLISGEPYVVSANPKYGASDDENTKDNLIVTSPICGTGRVEKVKEKLQVTSTIYGTGNDEKLINNLSTTSPVYGTGNTFSPVPYIPLPVPYMGCLPVPYMGHEPIIEPIKEPKGFPDGLNIEAWELWVEYRKKRCFPKYIPMSASNSMVMMVSFGDDKKQLETVNNAIAKQWKNLYPIGESRSFERAEVRHPASNKFIEFEKINKADKSVGLNALKKIKNKSAL